MLQGIVFGFKGVEVKGVLRRYRVLGLGPLPDEQKVGFKPVEL